MLFFITPDVNRPIGGTKQCYRNVQLLNEAGLPARILHGKPGQSCTWFEHETPTACLELSRVQVAKRWAMRQRVDAALLLRAGDVVYLEEKGGERLPYTLSSKDLIVVPEYHGARLDGRLEDFPVVVFNQNTHNSFRYYGIERRLTRSVYTQQNVLGAVTVSQHNQEYLQYSFPELEVERVINGVDARIFRPGGKKERRIAFMPRKMEGDLADVVNILSERDALRGWTLAPIDKMSEQEVAAEMRRAFVYLSTCCREGFGLPPVEAAMSGCLLVGYTGAAASEYFDPKYSYPVPQQDTLAFAQTLERVLRFCEEQEEQALNQSSSFAAQIKERYSLDVERESVVRVWSKFYDQVS